MPKSLSTDIKNFLKMEKATIISILAIFVIGLISISWFRGTFLIDGLDRSFPPDRIAFFQRGFSFWDTFILGSSNPRNFAGLLPTNLFLVISQLVGLSLVNAEKIWFYFLFSFSGISMYYLAITLSSIKYRQIVGLTSALFYMFNPFVMISVVPQMWIYIIFLPLVLAFFIKGIQGKYNLSYVFVICIIWTLTTASDYTNPKYLLFTFLPLLMFFGYYALLHRNKIKKSFRFLGLVSIVLFSLNAFWIIPVISSFNSVVASPLNAYAAIGTSRLISYNLGSAPLSGSFRLLGFWSLNADYKGYPYAYWAPAYNTSIFIIIGFLIPILLFAFLLKRPRNQNRIFFAILAVIGLFIMNGSSPPLGEINELIMKNVPFMVDIFSSPYTFGGMYVAVAFAFLFGCFIGDFLGSKILTRNIVGLKKDKSVKIAITGLLLFLVIGVYAFPLWTGDVIYPGNPVMASNRYQIPDYYNDAKNWLNTDASDFRLFSLPYSILGYGAYDWTPAGFNGPDPTEPLLGRSLIAGLAGQGLGLEAARYMVNNSDNNIAKVLALMNVKYVIIHNDAAWEYLSGNNWYVTPDKEQISNLLNNQTGFSFEKSFGKIDFYLNNYWQPMRIYATSSIIAFDGNIDQLIDIVKRPDFNLNNTAVSLSSQVTAKQLSSLNVTTEIVKDPDLDLSYNPIAPVSGEGRLIFMPKYQPVLEARYYSGWKGVISTNGVGEPGMIVFSSPNNCPYVRLFRKIL